MDLNRLLSQQLIDQFEDHVSVLNLNSEFCQLNQAQASVMGYRDPSEVLGCQYDAFQGKVSESAEQFMLQDKDVFTHKAPIQYISYDFFLDDGWLLLYAKKVPIKNEAGDIIGLYSCCQSLDSLRLIDLGRFVMKSQEKVFGKMKRKSFIFKLTDTNTEYKLTKRELEVLFYTLRGKTAKEISSLMQRTMSTACGHLETLKDKFKVSSRSQLIEKAIDIGYMNVVPETLFKQ